MFRPFPVFIGSRYTRARRRSHFISFMSLTSIIGLALGVLVMILVLSVMNGFQQELRGRILSMTAHATLNRWNGRVDDWRLVRDQALIPQVQQLAQRIFQQYPACVTPLIRRWFGERDEYSQA